MQYRKLKNTGETVSVLGLGCMRFPVIKDGDQEHINEPEAIQMIRTAIDNGVTYIDTAYPYHNRESEPLVGKALRDGYREKVMLATKSPVFSIEKEEDFDRILNEQLELLQTDHIDFYLLHSLGKKTWEDVVKKFDLISKIKKAKEDGKVRHIGFSFHDELPVFKQIIEEYPGCEFCQIQLNYADINKQAGVEGLRYAAEKGLDVIIMEPLRGGKLALPTENVQHVLGSEKTPTEWGLSYLWNFAEVGTVLSGMSTMEQLMENIAYADNGVAGCLSNEEIQRLEKAGEVFNKGALVGCTACFYCMPCPQGIEIPEVFRIYNMTATESWLDPVKKAYQELKTHADACIGCRRCEKDCPQHIPISAFMPQVKKVFAD